MRWFVPEFALALVSCLLPLPTVWTLLRWRLGARAPTFLRVLQFAPLSLIVWCDFAFSPVLYLAPRMIMPPGHPVWTLSEFTVYLTRPVHVGGFFRTVDQWWVSAVWLLTHRPGLGWRYIQLFWFLVALLVGWAAARGNWRYGSREPLASPTATHGSSRWRRPGERGRTLQRMPCDWEEGKGGAPHAEETG